MKQYLGWMVSGILVVLLVASVLNTRKAQGIIKGYQKLVDEQKAMIVEYEEITNQYVKMIEDYERTLLGK